MGSIGSLVFLPFVAAVLADSGQSNSEIAQMMIWMPIALTLGAPAWSWVADKTGKADWVLKGASTLALVAMLCFFVVETPLLQTLCLATLALARAPFGPLGDALTLKRLGGDKNSYGQIRMWGSVVYFVAALLGGVLRPSYPHAPLWMGCGLIVLAMAFCWTLPSKEFRIPKPPKGILTPLLQNPLIWLFLVLATLHGITITTYDNFFSLHVEKLGLSPSITGMGIATGVIAEVVVLAFGKPLLHRFGATWLIFVGVASSCPRFLFTGYVTSPEALILWQSLHGLGFGAFWIGGVAFLNRVAPPDAPNAAQSLLPASTFGAGYLCSLSLASVVFKWTDPATLFQALGLGSLFTIAATALFLRRAKAQFSDL